jgi:hypothetical protein
VGLLQCFKEAVKFKGLIWGWATVRLHVQDQRERWGRFPAGQVGADIFPHNQKSSIGIKEQKG